MAERRIFVVGSLNADHRVRVTRIPSAGETVMGGDITVSPGGKGANQAVAAARAGGAVTIVGAVGGDRDGEFLQRALHKDAVDTHHVRVISDMATGRALVTVDDDGENSIVVSPGANATLTAQHVDDGLQDMRAHDLLLLQLETPMPLVEYAARRASELGGVVVLNAAPVSASVTRLLAYIDVLVVNEHEFTGIADLLRGSAARPDAGRNADMHLLETASGATVVCTAGSDGAFWSQNGRIQHVEAHRVSPVDTTAAGDTFIGYLAAALAADPEGTANAIEYAVRAAGVAVTRPGAIDSIPYRHEIITAATQTGKETS